MAGMWKLLYTFGWCSHYDLTLEGGRHVWGICPHLPNNDLEPISDITSDRCPVP